jgi:hypothetical protein
VYYFCAADTEPQHFDRAGTVTQRDDAPARMVAAPKNLTGMIPVPFVTFPICTERVHLHQFKFKSFKWDRQKLFTGML